MLETVAHEHGQPFRAVAAEDFALTLYTYHQIQQRQRREAHAARGARIDAAQLAIWSFHQPKELDAEARRHEALTATLAGRPARAATLLALGRAFADAVASGRVLEN